VVVAAREWAVSFSQEQPARPLVAAAMRESLALAVAFTLAYGALAVSLQCRAPRLFAELDTAFDADLGFGTIDLARPQGPHWRTRIHPISVLLLNPFGSAVRAVLRGLGVEMAARLAAALLCALAGGATVGVFRLLLERLGVGAPRARLWTLVFAFSATQLFFSSVPESYAFSALSLVVLFWVAASKRSRLAHVAAGVFSFGITSTNLVAVTLARATGVDLRRPLEAVPTLARHVALVLAITAALALVQRAGYPTSGLWFVPGPLGEGYSGSIVWPEGAGQAGARAAGVASHMAFACLAAPRLSVQRHSATRAAVDFPRVPITAPRPAGAAHAVGWSVLLATAAVGLRGRLRSRPVLAALLAWLLFEALFHFVFGRSLFLYSAHWTFALVAVVAAGVGSRGGRPLTALLGAVVALQLVANVGLFADLLRLFGGPAG
jgi:hypothetical protein